MKIKTCKQCGEPFNVIEDHDDPAKLEKGTVYLGASAKTCMDCHRKSETAPDPKVVRAAAPTKAERLARYGRDMKL